MPKPTAKNRTDRLLASRSAALSFDAGGKPASLDEATRSVAVVASTEQPAMVMDWERWEVVPEVLLMSGCTLPANGRVPFLDSHSRFSVGDVIGSFRDIAVQGGATGPELTGRCYYSATPDGETPYQKTVEGHVTDVSIGYEIEAYTWVEDGKTVLVEGRSFTGPMRVVTAWTLKELSLCPIGADANAKVRNQQTPTPAAGHNKENAMPAQKSKTGGKRKAAQTPAAVMKKRIAAAEAEERAAKARLKALRAEAGEEETTDPELDADGNPVTPADGEGEEDETRADGEEDDDETRADGEEDDADGEGEEDDETRGKGGKRTAPKKGASIAARERARIRGIRTMCASFGISETMENQLIDKGVGLNSARKEVMDMVTTRSRSGGPHVSVGTTEGEKFRAAARDGLLIRCGIAVEKPAPGAENFRGYSLRELARESLVRSGQSSHGDIRAVIGRALTTTDLPMLLQDSTERTLMDAFEKAPENWNLWCEKGQVTDFRTNRAVGVDADLSLLELSQTGEYENGKLSETPEEYKIATYGRKIGITRESIINDDLNSLTVIPRNMGEACAKLIGDIAYGVLVANSKMGDGVALFDKAKHGNLHAAKGGVPTIDGVDAVKLAMSKQKDMQGNLLRILPKFFLAPKALETAAEQFFSTTMGGLYVVGTGDQPLIHNPFGGSVFTRVYEPRLDEDSATSWYMAAQRAVTVFFLNGVETPFMEQYQEPGHDGVFWRVRMDAGAKAMRWQLIAKATK